MEQPNATGDGDAALSLRFALAVVLTGVATGLLGDAMMVVLTVAEHLAYGYHDANPIDTLIRAGGTEGFQTAVERASGLRRVLSLLLAGAFAGPAWYLLRHWTRGERSELDDVLWSGDGRLSWRRSLGTSVISEIVVGMGASLGREAAPKLMGGVAGSLLSGWFGLSTPQRKLLVAAGGGAGLAAVYNVPLGGALFAAEILLGAITIPVVLPALVCSWIATSVAWLYLPDHATYTNIPVYHFSMSLLAFGILVGPVLGVASAGYIRLIGWVSVHRVPGRWALVGPLGAFGLLGLAGVAYPQLFGNGKGLAHMVFLGQGGLLLLVALFALKPIFTAACLGSGASGGLFTPTMSTGAVFGAALGLVWTHYLPGSPIGAFAIIGATAAIGASMQAPFTALVLVLELTHNGFELMVPLIAATTIATVVARALDGYSIYTARLPAERAIDEVGTATDD